MAQASILMCSEGTYPFYQGGVSVWAHQLVSDLTDFDFDLLSITHAPNQRAAFARLANIRSIQEIPLWGTEELGAADRSFSDIYARKARTTPAVISERVAAPFETVLASIFGPIFSAEKLGTALCELYKYFQDYDYSKTMTSPEVWRLFLEACRRYLGQDREFSLHDATTCMRWLQRYLTVLIVRIPEVNVVHSSMAGLAAVPGTISRILHGTPFVVTEHGIYVRELYLSIRNAGHSHQCRCFLLAFHKAVVRMNYYYADVITALGSFNRTWQVRLGASQHKIRFTPNGCDPAKFYPSRRPTNRRKVVLAIARVYPLKGIDHLLNAAAIVRQKVPDVIIRVLGEIADHAYHARCLELVERHQLTQNVEWGTTTNVGEALAAADIFCLPSVSEGMPYSVIEAMFSACPIVASDVGNIQEMLAGSGIVTRPGDPESLARALLTLLENEGAAAEYRERLAETALRRANTYYTKQEATDRFRRIYSELIYANDATALHATPERTETLGATT